MFSSKYIVILLYCYTWSVTQAKLQASVSKECQHIWTDSWQRLAHGIDLTKLDLQPVRDTLHRKNGMRETLFDWTCYQKRTFSLIASDNQLNSSSWAADATNHTVRLKSGSKQLKYSLPDDLQIHWHHWIRPHWLNGNVNSSSSASSSSSADLINEMDLSYDPNSMWNASMLTDKSDLMQPEVKTFEQDEYAFVRQQLVLLQLITNPSRSTWWTEAGFSQIANFTGAFKLTQKFKRMRWQRFVNARIAHESRIQIPAYRIMLPEVSKLPLSRRFVNAIERVNSDVNQTSEDYFRLIHLFGTHFYHQIDFGGSARIAYRKLESADGIDLNKLDEINGFEHKNSFDFKISPDRVHSENNFAVELSYFKSDQIVYEKTVTFYGGLVESESLPLDNWAESVPLNPWIIGGHILPISDLIKDPIKQALLQNAIVAYLDKAELFSAKEALISLKQLNIWNAELEHQLEQVEKLNLSPSTSHESIIDITKQIQDSIEHELIEYYRNHTFVTKYSDKTFDSNAISASQSAWIFSQWICASIVIMITWIRIQINH